MQACGRVTQLTYFYLLLYRNAKNYVEKHSGDLNKLQHFKESRIRVRVTLIFVFLYCYHSTKEDFSFSAGSLSTAEILSLLLALVGQNKQITFVVVVLKCCK